MNDSPPSAAPTTDSPARSVDEPLHRQLGTFDVFALCAGGAIGWGIFLYPAIAARGLGPVSILTFVVAGIAALLVASCFAEVGSRYAGTGGPMLYAREAFGPSAGFAAGWAIWVSRVVSWATLANGFVIVVTGLLQMIGMQVGSPLFVSLAPVIGIFALLGLLAYVNLAGSLFGGRTNTVVTILKITVLVVFIGAGIAYVDLDAFTPFAPHGLGNFAGTTVTVFYVYAGFEGLVIPAAEMRRPARDMPRGLLLGISTVMLLYLAVVFVCIGTLPNLEEFENPVGEAALRILGSWGGIAVQVGILISVFGINAYMAFVTPRTLYALGHTRLIPAWFGHVNARGVPARAILVSTAVAFTLAVTGSFTSLAAISVIARMLLYIVTSCATMRLRRMSDAPPATFRLPAGPLIPLLAILVCVTLIAVADAEKSLWGIGLILAGFPLYWFSRPRN